MLGGNGQLLFVSVAFALFTFVVAYFAVAPDHAMTWHIGQIVVARDRVNGSCGAGEACASRHFLGRTLRPRSDIVSSDDRGNGGTG
jgi:hypothetical protein